MTHVRDILSRITKWWEAGETFGLATVVRTYRSAPRDPGAALAVSSSAGRGYRQRVRRMRRGRRLRAVARRVPSGRPVLQTYGVSDDDAFAVGLTCGGIIDIFVERVEQGQLSPSWARSPRRSSAASRWRWRR